MKVIQHNDKKTIELNNSKEFNMTIEHHIRKAIELIIGNN